MLFSACKKKYEKSVNAGEYNINNSRETIMFPMKRRKSQINCCGSGRRGSNSSDLLKVMHAAAGMGIGEGLSQQAGKNIRRSKA